MKFGWGNYEGFSSDSMAILEFIGWEGYIQTAKVPYPVDSAAQERILKPERRTHHGQEEHQVREEDFQEEVLQESEVT